MINQIFALLIIYPGHGSEQIVPPVKMYFLTIDRDFASKIPDFILETDF